MGLAPWADRLGEPLGSPVRSVRALGGGCVAEVWRVDLRDGRAVVAKRDLARPWVLSREAQMLRYLVQATTLPTPEVHFEAPGLLVMELLPGRSGVGPAAQGDAAEHLARLHSHSGPAFGFSHDTVLGGLPLENSWTDSWLEFFRDHRLEPFVRSAEEVGGLDRAMMRRLEMVVGQLDRWIDPMVRPSLIHGDIWSGNVLSEGSRVTGFIDPAIYYADREMELAFIEMFDTFGDAFWRRYGELAPLDAEYRRSRRHLYVLIPILVHVRLFGASYVSSLGRALDALGV